MNNNRILMVGTSTSTMGGISTVVNAYITSGLFERYQVKYISTHCDGGFFKKILILLKSYPVFLFFLVFGKYSLVHFHVSSRASFWRKSIFILTAKILSKHIIFHLHGSEFREFIDEELGAFRRKIAVWIINRSDLVLVLSYSWREWMIRYAHKPDVIILENSIAPIHLPAEVTRVHNQLLFLGRIGQRKGFWDLLCVLKKLKEKGCIFNLKVGGDGELNHAKKLVKKYDLEDRVEFVGWVRGNEKRELLASSSIYLLPSYNEGMPMSILEALASGLPTVSTTVGGIPHQITDGVEGYLVSPGDLNQLEEKLALLLNSDNIVSKFSENACMKFNSNFSTKISLPKLEKIYSSLINDIA